MDMIDTIFEWLVNIIYEPIKKATNSFVAYIFVILLAIFSIYVMYLIIKLLYK